MEDKKIILYGKDGKPTAKIELLDCDQDCYVNDDKTKVCRLEIIQKLFMDLVVACNTNGSNEKLRRTACHFVSYITGGDNVFDNGYLIEAKTECNDCDDESHLHSVGEA